MIEFTIENDVTLKTITYRIYKSRASMHVGISRFYNKHTSNLIGEKVQPRIAGMAISLPMNDAQDSLIFLSADNLTHDIIAHETFHAITSLRKEDIKKLASFKKVGPRAIDVEEDLADSYGIVTQMFYDYIKDAKLKIS